MPSFCSVFRAGLAGAITACALLCLCAGPGVQASQAAAPRTARAKAIKKQTRTGWNFQAPDKSALEARWRESISATLKRTTFAPTAPAGRYLRQDTGSRLPPARLDDLDALRPPEQKTLLLGGKTPVRGEFTKERTGWRPHDDLAGTFSNVTPALREEHRAGAYADFHPDDNVAFKLGPEYHLGTSVMRPEQTGQSKDHPGALGLGMKLKVDF